ncbi:DUF397 domain-containing protein [Spirillospora sp. NBC_00431]
MNNRAVPEYRKSTYSGAGNENCVEVAITTDEVLVRNSRTPAMPALRFTYEEWDAFRQGVFDGEFDLPAS